MAGASAEGFVIEDLSMDKNLMTELAGSGVVGTLVVLLLWRVRHLEIAFGEFLKSQSVKDEAQEERIREVEGEVIRLQTQTGARL